MFFLFSLIKNWYYYTLKQQLIIFSFDKNKHYVLYCSDQACTASTYNVQMFLDAGFEHVWDYENGMAGWYQAGLPYEGPAQQSYLKNEAMDFGEDASELPVITTQELYDKMKEFRLL